MRTKAGSAAARAALPVNRKARTVLIIEGMGSPWGAVVE
jgi:hypothetical protein